MQTADASSKMSLWKLAWPIATETGFIFFMYSVDIWLLSTMGEEVVAGVGLADQLIFLLIIMFNVFATGSSMLAAQYLGAGHKEQAQRVGQMALWLNLSVGVLFSLFMFFFHEPLLMVFGAEEHVLQYAQPFAFIVGSMIFIFSIISVCSALLRVNGFTYVPMWVTIGINVLHLFVASTVIFGWFGIPKLGVVGASWSIVFSQFCAMLILVWFLVKRTGTKLWSDLRAIWDWIEIRKMLKIGGPAASEEAVWQLSQVFITVIVAMLGTEALAARVFAFNIILIMMQIPIALSLASSILVGHEIGASNKEQAYLMTHQNYHRATYVSIGLAILVILFREPLLSIYSDDPLVIAFGASVLLLTIVFEPGRNLNLIYIKSLNAAGDSFYPAKWAVISMLGISVPLAYLFGVVMDWGLLGVWCALLVDEWLRGILMWLRWRSKKWQSIELIKTV